MSEDEKTLLISSNKPKLYNIASKKSIEILDGISEMNFTSNFFDNEMMLDDYPQKKNGLVNLNTNYDDSIVIKQDNILNLTYLLHEREIGSKKSFFIIIKELYIIFLVKQSPGKIKDFLEKKFSTLQNEAINNFSKLLNSFQFSIIDVFALQIAGEIIQVQFDSLKNLILINSNDRILRLFSHRDNAVTLVKEYTDNVNRKKWINAFFYTFKVANISSNISQDIIVSALSDTNSLEFIFIDVNSGNYIKRIEPLKCQSSGFICHYLNHFSLIIISHRKLFLNYGYLINHWGAFAPYFKYVEENIEYMEEEDFFDNFNKILKKNDQKKIYDKESVLQIIKSGSNVSYTNSMNPQTNSNLFFKYSPLKDDPLVLESEKDLKEIFQQFNETIEFNNN